MYEGFSQKSSLVIVYTGEGKGKTTAGLGLLVRALGNGHRVAFVQFIKNWQVSEDKFFAEIRSIYRQQLLIIKGGKGFYNAGSLSAKGITKDQHQRAAMTTFRYALQAATSGEYQLVICDEINNAVHDGLISQAQLKKLIRTKHPQTSLCLTGRNFPHTLLSLVDIATNMTKIKHHFDDKFLANPGIDY